MVAGSETRLHACLASPSLRCAQLCLSALDEVAVVDAPSLERLFLISGMTKMSTTVKIGHAPKLRLLGYLEPGMHIMQIGNTIIKVRAAPGHLISDFPIIPFMIWTEQD